jgi:Sec-independent protein translocase protein TatA
MGRAVGWAILCGPESVWLVIVIVIVILRGPEKRKCDAKSLAKCS